MILNYISVATSIIVTNIPFGYWRQGVKKYSVLWFAFIHLPVPLVIWIRHIGNIQLSFATAPLLFGSFFLGQFLGKKMRLYTTK